MNPEPSKIFSNSRIRLKYVKMTFQFLPGVKWELTYAIKDIGSVIERALQDVT